MISSFHAIASIIFVKRMNAIIKRRRRDYTLLIEKLISSILYFKELFHVDIDPRAVGEEFFFLPIENYSLKAFDFMNQYSIVYKMFLVTVYVLFANREADTVN